VYRERFTNHQQILSRNFADQKGVGLYIKILRRQAAKENCLTILSFRKEREKDFPVVDFIGVGW
jgi:hypothetical protein